MAWWIPGSENDRAGKRYPESGCADGVCTPASHERHLAAQKAVTNARQMGEINRDAGIVERVEQMDGRGCYIRTGNPDALDNQRGFQQPMNRRADAHPINITHEINLSHAEWVKIYGGKG